MKKFQFASTTYAASLLKHCDASIDGFVFDKDIQKEVHCKILNLEKEETTIEDVRFFYSEIASPQTLKKIIDAVFTTSLKNTEEESHDLINMFTENDVYEKIWNTYKRPYEEVKEKEASETEGNNVRRVMKPMVTRIKSMEIEQRRMQARLERMENVLLKLAEK